jgi:hypothetical protein
LGVAPIPSENVVGHHAKRRIAVGRDFLDPALVDEVVDVASVPGGAERIVDLSHGQVLGPGPGLVDVDLGVRRAFHPIGAHGHAQGILASHPQKLVARFQKFFMAETG